MDGENLINKQFSDDNILCEDITPLLVHRRDMSELSEYFGRDARRYDNGFETY